MRKAAVIADIPATRPKTISSARGLIARILHEMPWDADEQARYFKIHGLEARTPADLNENEVRQLIADMEASRMINFSD
jgi:hypothetical protein